MFAKNLKMAWFAAYTKSRCELKALEYFELLGIKAYVPTFKEIRQWSDRKKTIEKPLISRYVFFKLNKLAYDLININPFIKSVVKHERKAIEISDSEMELLKNAVKFGTIDRKRICSGDFVKIKSGPFTNKEGIVESIGDKNIVLIINKLKIKLKLEFF